MKKLLVILGIAAALGQNASAQTETLDIWALGDSTPDAVTLSSLGSGLFGFDYAGSNQFVPEAFTTGGKTISIDLTELVFDADPSVRYAFGVNNPDGSTGTTPYAFTFSAPVTLAPGSYSAYSSVSGSLTKGDDGNSNPVTLGLPTSGGAVVQSFIGATTDAGGRQNAGVDLISSPVSVDPTAGNSQPFNSGGFSSPTVIDTLSSTASQISVTTAFQLSNSDSASFSGTFSVAAAPEPKSILLGLICAGLFGFIAVRRRRA